MTITLPDELKEPLERKAHAAGFATVADYFLSLVPDDEPDSEMTFADLGYASQDELEAHLLASLNSGPPIPVTPEFWEELNKKVAARVEQLKGEQ